MVNKVKSLGLIAVMCGSMGFGIHAVAADGFYVGGKVQSSTFGHELQRNTGDVTNPSITTFAEESDIAGGVFLGYKTHLTDDAFVSAEVFYNAENAETTNINNMLQTQLELESTYGINLKAGVDVTDKFSVYGIAGATWLDFDIHNSYPFAPPMTSGDASEAGLSLGAGFEYQVSAEWSVKGEYVQISDVSFDPIPEVAIPGKINPNEVDYDSLSIAISYSF